MAETGPLRRRMIEDVTVRHLSAATQRSCVHAVAKFSRFFGRSPDTPTRKDVRTFQVHLAAKGVASASLNQTVAALRFFHAVTLGMAEVPGRIAYAREPRRLPAAPSADEVARCPEAAPSLKARAALTTAYAAGLRVSEVKALRVADIDSGRMMIRIAQGKGGKERCAMLSAQLLGMPHAPAGVWRAPASGRFPAATPTAPSSRRRCTRPAGQRGRRRGSAGIGRKVTVDMPHATASPPICWRAASTSG